MAYCIYTIWSQPQRKKTVNYSLKDGFYRPLCHVLQI